VRPELRRPYMIERLTLWESVSYTSFEVRVVPKAQNGRFTNRPCDAALHCGRGVFD
jgi:hypothetical protein